MKGRMVLLVLFAALLPGSTRAQEKLLPTKLEEAKPPEAPPLDGMLSLALNVNFGNNKDVVGQFDGIYFNLGGSIIGALDYHVDGHDWRNTLTLAEGFAYGPPINKFVKSSDRLFIESTYYYHIPKVEWLGPFVGARLDTPVFEGADYRAADVTYEFKDSYGVRQPTRDKVGKQLHLTGYFKPMTLKESVGMFVRPLTMEAAELQFRVGFGAQEVFADGSLAVLGNGSVPGKTVSVIDLYSFQQAGFEAGVTFKGLAYDKKISYKAFCDFMIPFLRSNKSHNPKSATELTNVDLGASLGFKLVDWASLEYVLHVVRAPQMVDKWQIQNALMLTFAYTPIQRWSPPKKKEPCDCPPPAPPPAPAPAPDAAPAK